MMYKEKEADGSGGNNNANTMTMWVKCCTLKNELQNGVLSYILQSISSRNTGCL